MTEKLKVKVLQGKCNWIDGLLTVSLLVNAVALLLIWVDCFGPLSFQSVKTFEVLASGLPFEEIKRILGSGHECVPIGKDVGSIHLEGDFPIHPSAQFYPVSYKAYGYLARFPPGLSGYLTKMRRALFLRMDGQVISHSAWLY